MVSFPAQVEPLREVSNVDDAYFIPSDSTLGQAAPAHAKEAVMAKPRDTYKYQFKVGNKIVHGGITDDLERREAKHQQKWPKGRIKQVGPRTTERVAREWAKDKGYT